jgi:hypothetical protein
MLLHFGEIESGLGIEQPIKRMIDAGNTPKRRGIVARRGARLASIKEEQLIVGLHGEFQ